MQRLFACNCVHKIRENGVNMRKSAFLCAVIRCDGGFRSREQQQVFPVLALEQPGYFRLAEYIETFLGGNRFRQRRRGKRKAFVFDYSALVECVASQLELRLDEDDGLSALFEQSEDGIEDEGDGDETDIDGDEILFGNRR